MNRSAQQSAPRRRSSSDPLAVALQPPANETQLERENRLRAELEAKKRSDNIDRMLRETDRRNKKRKTIRVLLLGQSESGKSTTLKQFQILHTPAAFRAERLAWRFVIYLNLLRSVRRILDSISPEADAIHNGFDDGDEFETGEATTIVISSGNHSSASAQSTTVPNYDKYMKTLTPLFELEQRLISQLSDPDDNNTDQEATRLPTKQQAWTNSAVPQTYPLNGNPNGNGTPRITIPLALQSDPSPPVSPTTISNGELSLPPTSNWKKALAFGRVQSPKSAHSGELQGWWEDPEDPVHTLNRYAPYIKELWKDQKVRQKLLERRVRLEESSGFYLDQIDRITAKMYFPTDDDVLKARLRTTGVTEHLFEIDHPDFRGVDWKVYDVGGARHQRQAWVPYFDDVDAIIFLAPISAFDQVLAEDNQVNRLHDSLQLWKSVVSNKLLSNVNIILFLNKIDLLKKKLESGVKLRNHMHGYRDRPNDYSSVSKFFRNKFGAIHQEYTPDKSRELYIHLTSVVDTRHTRTIIMTVRDIILQTNLRGTALM